MAAALVPVITTVLAPGLGFLLSKPSRLIKFAAMCGASFGAFKLLSPHALKFICKKCFDKIDANKNGKLDHVELQLAVYEVYNMLNKRFPGWSDPPSRAVILEALKAHDVNGDSHLDQEEFHTFVKDILSDGGDKFFKRFGTTSTKEMVVVPAATPVVKQLVPGLASVPDSLLSPLVSQFSGMITGTK